MNSADLGGVGFGGWSRFNSRSEAAVLARAPLAPGVYCIRCRSSEYTHPIGLSDILYIGSAAGAQGLQGRLRYYFRPGPTQWTNRRILAKCGESEDYEIGFVVTLTGDEAIALESRLLTEFVAQHGGLPPENKRRPDTTAAAPVATVEPGASLILMCRSCSRAVPLPAHASAALRAAGAAAWSEPMQSVFGRVGHLLKCGTCGSRRAALLQAVGQAEALAIAPRKVATDRASRRLPDAMDSDTFLISRSAAGNSHDSEIDPWASEDDAYEDDYYLDEYAHYDPDRDEMVDADDEGNEEELDYDVDLDDKDDWS